MPDIGSLATPMMVGLAFGGGLVPSLAKANQAAISSLTQAGAKFAPSPANGPVLRSSASWHRLGYPEPLYLADVIEVVGRVSAGRLAATESDGFLQRDELEREFEALPRRMSLRARDGSPLPLLAASYDEAQLPPLAFDATWTALSTGSSFVSTQEIERQLARWRPDPDTFVLEEYEKSLLQGRSAIFSGYVILFGLQAMVLALLVVLPLVQALQD
jgi:hypothetical protein